VEDLIYVLVVDDDDADALLVEDLLRDAKRRSFKVDAVATYDAGRRLISEGEYDVVLLDHQLGARSGTDLLREVGRRPGLPPIVMLTGMDPESADQEALEAGACDLVTKQEVLSIAGLLERTILYALERHEQKRRLQESEERYALAVAGSTDGIWDWHPDSEKLHGSARFREILGLPVDDSDPVDMHLWRSRIAPEDLASFDAALRAHCRGATPVFQHEHRVVGSAFQRWVRVRGVAVRDALGKPRRVAGSLTDVHSEKMAQHQIQHQAVHDQLTGVYNRQHLHETLARHVATAAENPAHSFSVVYVDLDRFKPLNDGLGHLVGDEIIFETARRLKLAVGDRGVVTRHGGDEFVAVLHTSDREAMDIAESIQRAFRHPFDLHGGGRRVVTASIGVAHGGPSYTDQSEIIRDADIAMYRAKQQGRDELVVFDDGMREETLRRFALEEDLSRGLAEGEVYPVYQPIVSLATGTIIAVETLLRWAHPKYGPVPPPEFIAIAEENGLIVKLGEQVLERVVRDMRSWPETGVSVSVNVSALEFSDSNLVDRFRRKTRGLPPGSINIEITETTIVHNEHKVSQILQELREMGVHAHLDDFGTGFASVSHLVTLPLEGVKIDMSLVRKIDDPRYQSTVKAVIDLAHGLGMYTVVEGVETSRQRSIVTDLGADFAQGYLFSRPVPADGIKELLEKGVNF
jgi:diguanylate cyclase (GGDEF)-like protein/PAS domain S-box-containing protein